MEIKKLEWDSSFFGKEIGLIKIAATEMDSYDFTNSFDVYDLLYVFSEVAIPELEGRLVDTKIILVKDLIEINVEIENIKLLNSSNPSFYSDLLELAYLSGKYSRFKLDTNFTTGSFERLYKTWLDKTIDKSYGKELCYAEIDGEVAGFITINEDSNKNPEIGLISVNKEFQGLGIGSSLINFVSKRLISDGLKKLKVATQQDNLPALKLYEKNNFNLFSKTYIYHLWK